MPNMHLIKERFRENAIRGVEQKDQGIRIRLENDFTFHIDDFGGKILPVKSGIKVPKTYHLTIDIPEDLAVMFLSGDGDSWGTQSRRNPRWIMLYPSKMTKHLKPPVWKPRREFSIPPGRCSLPVVEDGVKD